MGDVKNAEEINKMILGTQDKETQAVLMVLQKLTLAVEHLVARLDENDERFRAHVEKFEEHAVEEMQLINRGIGGWRIIAIAGPIMIGAIGSLGFYSLSLHVGELTREMVLNQTQQVEIQALRVDQSADRATMNAHIRVFENIEELQARTKKPPVTVDNAVHPRTENKVTR